MYVMHEKILSKTTNIWHNLTFFMLIFARINVFVFCARMVYSSLSQYGRSLGSICVHTCFAYVDDHINPLYKCYFLSCMLHFMKILDKNCSVGKWRMLTYILSQIARSREVHPGTLTEDPTYTGSYCCGIVFHGVRDL